MQEINEYLVVKTRTTAGEVPYSIILCKDAWRCYLGLLWKQGNSFNQGKLKHGAQVQGIPCKFI